MPRRNTPKKRTRTKGGRLESQFEYDRREQRRQAIRSAPSRKVRRGGKEYVLIELPPEQPNHPHLDDYELTTKENLDA
jgi:hypothetical protein